MEHIVCHQQNPHPFLQKFPSPFCYLKLGSFRIILPPLHLHRWWLFLLHSPPTIDSGPGAHVLSAPHLLLQTIIPSFTLKPWILWNTCIRLYHLLLLLQPVPGQSTAHSCSSTGHFIPWFSVFQSATVFRFPFLFCLASWLIHFQLYFPPLAAFLPLSRWLLTWTLSLVTISFPKFMLQTSYFLSPPIFSVHVLWHSKPNTS